MLKLPPVEVEPPKVTDVALTVPVDGRNAAKCAADETVIPVAGTLVVTGNWHVNHATLDEDNEVTMPANIYGFTPLA